MLLAVASSQESIASQYNGSTRRGNRRRHGAHIDDFDKPSTREATGAVRTAHSFSRKLATLATLSNNQCTLVSLHCISTSSHLMSAPTDPESMVVAPSQTARSWVDLRHIPSGRS